MNDTPQLIYRVRTPQGQLLSTEYVSEADIPEVIPDALGFRVLRDDCEIERHPAKERRNAQ